MGDLVLTGGAARFAVSVGDGDGALSAAELRDVRIAIESYIVNQTVGDGNSTPANRAKVKVQLVGEVGAGTFSGSTFWAGDATAVTQKIADARASSAAAAAANAPKPQTISVGTDDDAPKITYQGNARAGWDDAEAASFSREVAAYNEAHPDAPITEDTAITVEGGSKTVGQILDQANPHRHDGEGTILSVTVDFGKKAAGGTGGRKREVYYRYDGKEGLSYDEVASFVRDVKAKLALATQGLKPEEKAEVTAHVYAQRVTLEGEETSVGELIARKEAGPPPAEGDDDTSRLSSELLFDIMSLIAKAKSDRSKMRAQLEVVLRRMLADGFISDAEFRNYLDMSNRSHGAMVGVARALLLKVFEEIEIEDEGTLAQMEELGDAIASDEKSRLGTKVQVLSEKLQRNQGIKNQILGFFRDAKNDLDEGHAMAKSVRDNDLRDQGLYRWS